MNLFLIIFVEKKLDGDKRGSKGALGCVFVWEGGNSSGSVCVGDGLGGGP